MSEYEDLRNIQASMERLLHEEGELMGSAAEVSAGDFNGNPAEGQELFDSLASENDQDNNNMAIDDDDEADEDEEDDDGEEEEEAEEEDCSNGSPADEDHSNNSQLNEEWHSGARSLTHLWKNVIFQFHFSFIGSSMTMSQKVCLPLHHRRQCGGPVRGGAVPRQHLQSPGRAPLQPGAADGLGEVHPGLQ